MKKMFKAVVVLAMIGGWPLAFSALHVVHTPGPTTVMGVTVPEWASWRVMTKENLAFRQTFADTRHWTLNDIADHAVVANRLHHVGLDSAFAHAGTSDEIAAALRGEKRDEPIPAIAPEQPAKVAIPPSAPAPAVPAVKTQSKPVVHVKPASPPATQPTAGKSGNVFDFPN